MSDANISTVQSSTEWPLRRAVEAFREKLKHTDPSTLAALRRAAGSDAPPPAFYRFAGGVLEEIYERLPDQGDWRDDFDARWSIVVSAMANAKDFLGHLPLGQALAEANVAELRVLRLLEAEGAQLPNLVRTMVHQLVQRGQPFDPIHLAWLVLEPDNDEPRRRIARDYYRYQKP